MRSRIQIALYLLVAFCLQGVSGCGDQCPRARAIRNDVDSLRLNIGLALDDRNFAGQFCGWGMSKMAPRLSGHSTYVRNVMQTGAIAEAQGVKLANGLDQLKASLASFCAESAKSDARESRQAAALEAALSSIDREVAPTGARLLQQACGGRLEMPVTDNGQTTVETARTVKDSGSSSGEGAAAVTFEAVRQLYFFPVRGLR